MRVVYCVLGYGIPQHIAADARYGVYLPIAFNKIYSHIERYVVREPHIVLSGGPTGYDAMEKSTEAESMKAWWLEAMKRAHVSGWHVHTEWESLSTFEHMWHSNILIEQQGLGHPEVHICCEQTRMWRVGQLAERLFTQGGFEVHGIDFDTTERRYRGLDTLLRQERLQCSYDLEALNDVTIRREHHQRYEDKYKELRQIRAEDREDAQLSWEKKFNEHLLRIYPF